VVTSYIPEDSTFTVTAITASHFSKQIWNEKSDTKEMLVLSQATDLAHIWIMLSPYWKNVTKVDGCKAGHHYQV
jgi:hypothetical protein